jgi:hypothetical protein
MPQVQYKVVRGEEAWTIAVNGRSFGPYSTLETAMAAAARAAHKAEAQGYEASVQVEDEAPSEA